MYYFFAPFIFCSLLFAACEADNSNRSTLQSNAKNKACEEDVDRLSRQITESEYLRDKADEYVKSIYKNDTERAKFLYKHLTTSYPNAPETSVVKYIESIRMESPRTQGLTASEKVDRNPTDSSGPQKIKTPSLDIKNIKTVSSCKVEDVEVISLQSSMSKKWIFDRNQYEYHYNTAEKGNIFLVLNYTVRTKSKNPKLPVFIAAKVDSEGNVTPFDVLDIRLRNWSSYGAYLGNYHDDLNDFAIKDNVNFTSAVQIPEEDIKNKKIIVYISDFTCLERSTGSGSPPVYYHTYPCEDKAKSKTVISEVRNVVKIFNNK